MATARSALPTHPSLLGNLARASGIGFGAVRPFVGFLLLTISVALGVPDRRTTA